MATGIKINPIYWEPEAQENSNLLNKTFTKINRLALKGNLEHYGASAWDIEAYIKDRM